MLTLIFAAALATPTPPPGWTSAAHAASSIVAEYARHEPDGTDSTIMLQIQNCICEPETMASILQAQLKQMPDATVARSTGLACDQPTATIQVTGLAQAAPHGKNFLMTFFRSNQRLYAQIYIFTSAAPKPDAIATAQELCPSLLVSLVSTRRFAVVLDKTLQPDAQPAFDLWANNIAAAFARGFLVTTVPMPAGSTAADPSICNSLGLVGFLEPTRSYEMTSTLMTTTVRLRIFDCGGNAFFDESSALRERRNQSQTPQTQADSLALAAIDMLLEKFSQFESGHQALWAHVLQTGALDDTPQMGP